VGENFQLDFRPQLTPAEMLELGVFAAVHDDCAASFAEWFARAKLCHERHDPALNFFGVNASQPLSVWRAKGWIYTDDRVAGSNGIAATTWAGAAPTMSAR